MDKKIIAILLLFIMVIVTGTAYAQDAGNIAVIENFEVVSNSSINDTNPAVASANITNGTNNLNIVEFGIVDNNNLLGNGISIPIFERDFSGVNGIYTSKPWTGNYMVIGNYASSEDVSVFTTSDISGYVLVQGTFRQNETGNDIEALAWFDETTLNLTGVTTQLSDGAVLLEIEDGNSTFRPEIFQFNMTGNMDTVYSSDRMFELHTITGNVDDNNPYLMMAPVPSGEYQIYVSANAGISESDKDNITVQLANVDTIQPVSPPEIGPPSIIMYNPNLSPVTSDTAEHVTFDITANQTVNVSWFLNDEDVKNETGVHMSSYTNDSPAVGNWAVTVVIENSNGSDQREWNWTVTPYPTTPNGSISGYVYIDTNGNKIKDAGDEPLSGTYIELIGAIYMQGSGAFEIVHLDATTDNNGFYEFDNLEPGKYFLIKKIGRGFLPSGSMLRTVKLLSEPSVGNNFLMKQS